MTDSAGSSPDEATPLHEPAMRAAPDRFYLANLQRVAVDRDRSDILDSRVRFWCDRLEVDPAIRYEALANGRTITFITKRRGHVVLLHRIRPDELA